MTPPYDGETERRGHDPALQGELPEGASPARRWEGAKYAGYGVAKVGETWYNDSNNV